MQILNDSAHPTDTALIADTATGVEDFYSQEQNLIKTIIKLCFYPWLCQFLMKIISGINHVCACIRTSAEDDNFPTEGGGGVYLIILSNLRVFIFFIRQI